MTPTRSLYDLTLSELTEWMAAHNEPSYRAKQIFHASYHRPIREVAEIKEIPASLRQTLSRGFLLHTLISVDRKESSDGTIKWLSKLSDGELLETVLIPAKKRLSISTAAPDASVHRRTVCVSTQVGCAYGCTFCASGMNGFRRNLTAGEIIQQVLLVQPRITNVVFMGMGEPLANYDNLLKAIRILNSPEGLHIGARKITVSTVGLIPMIERLSKEGLQIELSISLHAPNDEVRGKIMPVNKKYPVAELIKACRDYVKATNRLITFEYILIHGLNDSRDQAKELVELLKNFKSKVNLIPCHPIPGTRLRQSDAAPLPSSGSPWEQPPLPQMIAFEKFLKENGLLCTLRRSRGLDIEGACGQLRLRREASSSQLV